MKPTLLVLGVAAVTVATVWAASNWWRLETTDRATLGWAVVKLGLLLSVAWGVT